MDDLEQKYGLRIHNKFSDKVRRQMWPTTSNSIDAAIMNGDVEKYKQIYLFRKLRTAIGIGLVVYTSLSLSLDTNISKNGHMIKNDSSTHQEDYNDIKMSRIYE